MSLRLFTGVALGAIALVGIATPASADTYLSAFTGVTFGLDAGATKPIHGVTISAMGSVLGLEVEYGHAPAFRVGTRPQFSTLPPNERDVRTFTAGLQIGGNPINRGLRPYISAGSGLVRREQQLSTRTGLGLYVGAGVVVLLQRHVGVRADLRYLRSFEKVDPKESNYPVVGDFDFWRGTIAASFRF
jgi:hypothetical protein